ncbi:hypothetical protein [Azohydromonas lata]|uniref:Uncharacterized protein n=1 Tax=Azohydromonas lata TaxID=45677 RepID=A0ABU5ID58_9BURK|nr:hypothetical protein [Azohydromonas lata]MDZ5457039.1 hypothetical protein [Azohydromonas lata]
MTAPRRVFLFSGHMPDVPGRTPPRFPMDKVPAARQRIAGVLDAQGAGAQDLALSQAAAGGDLLFLQACVARGLRCEVLLPFEEDEFIRRSVEPVSEGERWRALYEALRPHWAPPRLMPRELGPLPDGVNAFERCNLWLLHTALAQGAGRVHLVVLWNGDGSGHRGGTDHMVREARAHAACVHWIDARTLA